MAKVSGKEGSRRDFWDGSQGRQPRALVPLCSHGSPVTLKEMGLCPNPWDL